MSSHSFRWFDVATALDQVGEGPALTEMLELVVSSIRRDLPIVRNLLAEGNTAEAHSILHPMKGFMPIFCIPAMADEVAALEMMCKRSELEAAKPALESLAPQLLEFANEVERYMSEPNA